MPGLLISQHSGEGKANQYYLRGFNLDHGTDFATTIAGVPVNMPTNAHGQGYTDLNFLIPELIGSVQYRKGTYSVEDGDFSSAGSAHISYRNTLASPIASLTAGEEGYRRAFAAASTPTTVGNLIGALEIVGNDGPWVHPDDFRKLNGVVRWSRVGSGLGIGLTAIGYDGQWNSTDQIPERAVASGGISRFGAIDPTDGGSSHRYSLSAELQHRDSESLIEASAYVLAYRLDLFSDFTYFLTDSIHGDQFEQSDDRVVEGIHVSRMTSDDWLGGEIHQTVGLDVRNDDIAGVGLFHTEARHRLATVREDRVLETSASPFVEGDLQWTPKVRSILGVRADAYYFHVASSFAPFTGSDVVALVSPKASLALGPWGPLELYLDGGYGFHSSDARGARFIASGSSQQTQSAEVSDATEHFPVPGGPQIERGSLLVRTKGAEAGARISGGSRGSMSATLWGLDIASETVFQGDAGLAAPSRPGRRTGVELASDLRLLDDLHGDAASPTRARDSVIPIRWGITRSRGRALGRGRVPASVGGVCESARSLFRTKAPGRRQFGAFARFHGAERGSRLVRASAVDGDARGLQPARRARE